MTEEQSRLVLQILSRLDDSAFCGSDWSVKCRYCNGRMGGYADSWQFDHSEGCIVPLVEMLRRTMLDESVNGGIS
jgi:hypothetical protein